MVNMHHISGISPYSEDIQYILILLASLSNRIVTNTTSVCTGSMMIDKHFWGTEKTSRSEYIRAGHEQPFLKLIFSVIWLEQHETIGFYDLK